MNTEIDTPQNGEAQENEALPIFQEFNEISAHFQTEIKQLQNLLILLRDPQVTSFPVLDEEAVAILSSHNAHTFNDEVTVFLDEPWITTREYFARISKYLKEAHVLDVKIAEEKLLERQLDVIQKRIHEIFAEFHQSLEKWIQKLKENRTLLKRFRSKIFEEVVLPSLDYDEKNHALNPEYVQFYKQSFQDAIQLIDTDKDAVKKINGEILTQMRPEYMKVLDRGMREYPDFSPGLHHIEAELDVNYPDWVQQDGLEFLGAHLAVSLQSKLVTQLRNLLEIPSLRTNYQRRLMESAPPSFVHKFRVDHLDYKWKSGVVWTSFPYNEWHVLRNLDHFPQETKELIQATESDFIHQLHEKARLNEDKPEESELTETIELIHFPTAENLVLLALSLISHHEPGGTLEHLKSALHLPYIQEELQELQAKYPSLVMVEKYLMQFSFMNRLQAGLVQTEMISQLLKDTVLLADLPPGFLSLIEKYTDVDEIGLKDLQKAGLLTPADTENIVHLFIKLDAFSGAGRQFFNLFNEMSENINKKDTDLDLYDAIVAKDQLVLLAFFAHKVESIQDPIILKFLFSEEVFNIINFCIEDVLPVIFEMLESTPELARAPELSTLITRLAEDELKEWNKDKKGMKVTTPEGRETIGRVIAACVGQRFNHLTIQEIVLAVYEGKIAADVIIPLISQLQFLLERKTILNALLKAKGQEQRDLAQFFSQLAHFINFMGLHLDVVDFFIVRKENVQKFLEEFPDIAEGKFTPQNYTTTQIEYAKLLQKKDPELIGFYLQHREDYTQYVDLNTGEENAAGSRIIALEFPRYFLQKVTREKFTSCFGAEAKAFLSALPTATDEERNAFTHNPYDRTTAFLRFLIDNNRQTHFEIDAQNLLIASEYIKTFGFARTPQIFYAFNAIYRFENQGIQLPQEIQTSGVTSLENLTTRVRSTKEKAMSDEEMLNLDNISAFEIEVLNIVTGKATHRFDAGRHSFTEIVNDFSKAAHSPEFARVPEGYTPRSFTFQEEEVKVKQTTMLMDAYKKIQPEVLAALEHTEAFEDLKNFIRSKFEAKINEVTAALEKLGQEKQRFLLENRQKFEVTKEEIGEIGSADELLLFALRYIADKSQKDNNLKFQLESVVRQLILRRTFHVQNSDAFMENMRLQLQDTPTPDGLSSLSTVINHQIRDHTLQWGSEEISNFWSSEVQTQIAGIKNGKPLFEFFGPILDQIDEAFEHFERELKQSKRIVRVVPDRGLIGECSAYLADVCYSAEYPLLEKRPSLIPFKFIIQDENGTIKEFFGSTLVFEVKDQSGNDCLLLRGFNIPNQGNINSAQVLEVFLDYLQEVGILRNKQAVLVPGNSGAISNYSPIINQVLNTYAGSIHEENRRELAERFAFNGYDITKYVFVARICGEATKEPLETTRRRESSDETHRSLKQARRSFIGKTKAEGSEAA